MTGIVIQARLGSTRLKEKALLPLGGLPLLERACIALSEVSADARVLATDSKSEPRLGPIARAHGFETVVGPEEDVLERFAIVVRRYGFDRVVRATGDNPLVSWELARLALERAEAESADYFGFVGMPLGMGVEILGGRALLKAASEARDPYEREHVAPYLYRHPELFKIARPEAPEEFLFPEGRVTVDVLDDYTIVAEIFDRLDLRAVPPYRAPSALDVIAELKNRERTLGDLSSPGGSRP